jgi:hypothetical protein
MEGSGRGSLAFCNAFLVYTSSQFWAITWHPNLQNATAVCQGAARSELLFLDSTEVAGCRSVAYSLVMLPHGIHCPADPAA